MHDEELFFDTTVLSNFARIEKLPLLWKFSVKISTTKEVIEETILFMNGLRSEGVLGKGEISLMGAAKETNAVFVTDDKGAKNKAQRLGVKVLDVKEHRDTVTILKVLLQRGYIEKNEYNEIRQLLK